MRWWSRPWRRRGGASAARGARHPPRRSQAAYDVSLPPVRPRRCRRTRPGASSASTAAWPPRPTRAWRHAAALGRRLDRRRRGAAEGAGLPQHREPRRADRPGQHLAGAGTTPYGQCDGDEQRRLLLAVRLGARVEQRHVVLRAGRRARPAWTAIPGDYIWWLDVETDNTWQSGSAAALARNRAPLEGMAAYLASRRCPGGHLRRCPTQWDDDRGPGDLGQHPLPAAQLAGRGHQRRRRDGGSAGKQPLRRRAARSLMAQYVSGGLDRSEPGAPAAPGRMPRVR